MSKSIFNSTLSATDSKSTSLSRTIDAVDLPVGGIVMFRNFKEVMN